MPPGTMLGFALLPDVAATISNQPEAMRQWRQSDLEEAIGAAEKAGLEAYRIEVGPDGTISIIVGLAAEAESRNRYGDLQGGL